MKQIKFSACLLLSLLVGASTDLALAKGRRPTNQVTFAQTAKIEATIVKIDHKNRVVTLKGPQGNVVDVDVGQDAPNFDQLKKGDKVRAQYYQSTTLALKKPGEEATSGEEEQVTTVPAQGQQGPSRMMLNKRRITATVQDIDRQNRTVTLKGPEGNTVELKVGEDVKAFDQLKQGDQVVATYTDALGISVERE